MAEVEAEEDHRLDAVVSEIEAAVAVAVAVSEVVAEEDSDVTTLAEVVEEADGRKVKIKMNFYVKTLRYERVDFTKETKTWRVTLNTV